MSWLILLVCVVGGAAAAHFGKLKNWRVGAWVGLTLAVFLLVAKAVLFPAPPSKSSVQETAIQAPPNVNQLQQAIDRRLANATGAGWSRVAVEEAEKRTFRIIVWYDSMPSGHRQVEQDTKRVARETLAALQEFGRSPSEERLFLSVWARKPESGETGKDLVRVFGRTSYSYATDSLTYKPQQ